MEKVFAEPGCLFSKARLSFFTMYDGNKIRTVRRAAGIDAQVLAEKAGCSRGTLSRIENGKQQPSGELAWRLAKLLDRPLADFYVEGVDHQAEMMADLDPEELALIRFYRTLSPEDQRNIRSFAAGVGVRTQAAEQHPSTPPESPK